MNLTHAARDDGDDMMLAIERIDTVSATIGVSKDARLLEELLFERILVHGDAIVLSGQAFEVASGEHAETAAAESIALIDEKIRTRFGHQVPETLPKAMDTALFRADAETIKRASEILDPRQLGAFRIALLDDPYRLVKDPD